MKVRDIEFEKCGDIIVAPSANVFALTCGLCNDVFLTLVEFKGHVLKEHKVYLGIRNGYDTSGSEIDEKELNTNEDELNTKTEDNVIKDVCVEVATPQNEKIKAGHKFEENEAHGNKETEKPNYIKNQDVVEIISVLELPKHQVTSAQPLQSTTTIDEKKNYLEIMDVDENDCKKNSTQTEMDLKTMISADKEPMLQSKVLIKEESLLPKAAQVLDEIGKNSTSVFSRESNLNHLDEAVKAVPESEETEKSENSVENTQVPCTISHNNSDMDIDDELTSNTSTAVISSIGNSDNSDQLENVESQNNQIDNKENVSAETVAIDEVQHEVNKKKSLHKDSGTELKNQQNNEDTFEDKQTEHLSNEAMTIQVNDRTENTFTEFEDVNDNHTESKINKIEGKGVIENNVHCDDNRKEQSTINGLENADVENQATNENRIEPDVMTENKQQTEVEPNNITNEQQADSVEMKEDDGNCTDFEDVNENQMEVVDESSIKQKGEKNFIENKEHCDDITKNGKVEDSDVEIEAVNENQKETNLGINGQLETKPNNTANEQAIQTEDKYKDTEVKIKTKCNDINIDQTIDVGKDKDLDTVENPKKEQISANQTQIMDKKDEESNDIEMKQSKLKNFFDDIVEFVDKSSVNRIELLEDKKVIETTAKHNIAYEDKMSEVEEGESEVLKNKQLEVVDELKEKNIAENSKCNDVKKDLLCESETSNDNQSNDYDSDLEIIEQPETKQISPNQPHITEEISKENIRFEMEDSVIELDKDDSMIEEIACVEKEVLNDKQLEVGDELKQKNIEEKLKCNDVNKDLSCETEAICNIENENNASNDNQSKDYDSDLEIIEQPEKKQTSTNQIQITEDQINKEIVSIEMEENVIELDKDDSMIEEMDCVEKEVLNDNQLQIDNEQTQKSAQLNDDKDKQENDVEMIVQNCTGLQTLQSIQVETNNEGKSNKLVQNEENNIIVNELLEAEQNLKFPADKNKQENDVEMVESNSNELESSEIIQAETVNGSNSNEVVQIEEEAKMESKTNCVLDNKIHSNESADDEDSQRENVCNKFTEVDEILPETNEEDQIIEENGNSNKNTLDDKVEELNDDNIKSQKIVDEANETQIQNQDKQKIAKETNSENDILDCVKEAEFEDVKSEASTDLKETLNKSIKLTKFFEDLDIELDDDDDMEIIQNLIMRTEADDEVNDDEEMEIKQNDVKNENENKTEVNKKDESTKSQNKIEKKEISILNCEEMNESIRLVFEEDESTILEPIETETLTEQLQLQKSEALISHEIKMETVKQTTTVCSTTTQNIEFKDNSKLIAANDAINNKQKFEDSNLKITNIDIKSTIVPTTPNVASKKRKEMCVGKVEIKQDIKCKKATTTESVDANNKIEIDNLNEIKATTSSTTIPTTTLNVKNNNKRKIISCENNEAKRTKLSDNLNQEGNNDNTCKQFVKPSTIGLDIKQRRKSLSATNRKPLNELCYTMQNLSNETKLSAAEEMKSADISSKAQQEIDRNEKLSNVQKLLPKNITATLTPKPAKKNGTSSARLNPVPISKETPSELADGKTSTSKPTPHKATQATSTNNGADDILNDILEQIGDDNMTTDQAAKEIFESPQTLDETENGETVPLPGTFDVSKLLEKVGLAHLNEPLDKTVTTLQSEFGEKFACAIKNSEIFGKAINFKQTERIQEMLKQLTKEVNKFLPQTLQVWELKSILNSISEWIHKSYSVPVAERKHFSKETLRYLSIFNFLSVMTKQMFFCEYCSLVNNTTLKHTQHVETHMNPKCLSCPTCFKVYKRPSAYESHVEKCMLASNN